MTMIMDNCLSAALFSDCARIGVCKHKINSPIDEKMRDPAHKIQTAAPDKTDEKNLFCGEIHCEIYAALLHHNLPKVQLRQPKVAKTERATGNNTCDQRCIST